MSRPHAKNNKQRNENRLSIEMLEQRRLLAADLGQSWEPINDFSPSDSEATRIYARPTEFLAVSLDTYRLSEKLANAPEEDSMAARNQPLVVDLPHPDGSSVRFGVWQSPIMAPELAAKFPEIQTYAGRGLDDPSAAIRFDITPFGLRAQVLSPNGNFYVDPYSDADTSVHVSYFSHDAAPFEGDLLLHGPGDHDHHDHDHHDDHDDECCCDECLSKQLEALTSVGNRQIGGLVERRTLRLAVAATGEYTSAMGGTVLAAMSGIATTVNRVNGIFERDLSVRMELVADNDQIVYTNGGTDPYSGTPNNMLGQNQSNLDTVIGSADYGRWTRVRCGVFGIFWRGQSLQRGSRWSKSPGCVDSQCQSIKRRSI